MGGRRSHCERQAGLIFKRLRTCSYFKGLPHNELAEEIAAFCCVTNAPHPFQDGNGGTRRVFLTQLICNAGYEINFADTDTNLLERIFTESILL